MAYQGVLEDIRACINLKKPRRIPVFANSEEFDVKWFEKYTYEEVCTSADKIVEVWSAAIREFDYDWAWVQIDDCIEFEVLGVGCVGSGNILRATRDYLPATRDRLKQLKLPDPDKSGRMPMKLEAIRRLKETFQDTVCVVGSNAAPYSSVGLLFGLEAPMLMMFEDRGLLQDAMDFFTDLQSRWAAAQVKAGADAIWLGDCNAFSGMLSPRQYREVAFEPCRKVVRAIQQAGGIVILHNSEISIPHIEVERETGADCLSIGPAADLAAVKKAMAGKACIMGNLDPIATLMQGTPASIEREVERIMRIGQQGAGYIFNTGEMNPRDVPAGNMRAMIRKAKALSRPD